MTLLNIEILGMETDILNLILTSIILLLVIARFFQNKSNESETVNVQNEQANAPMINKPVSNDLEVVAAITAAISAFSEAEGKNYTIKSITPVKKERNLRSAWGNAGVLDNTRAF